PSMWEERPATYPAGPVEPAVAPTSRAENEAAGRAGGEGAVAPRASQLARTSLGSRRDDGRGGTHATHPIDRPSPPCREPGTAGRLGPSPPAARRGQLRGVAGRDRSGAGGGHRTR